MTTPNGCAYCGVEAREHVQRWKPPVGWHRWVAPSQELIKGRMLARREATNNINEGEAR
ncbi:hypothetical protein OIE13_22600 [Streptosporangium sp. NBC_01810]|uniref:hypothetical protein n=1 Tax=Streptosporangium sp. NBC_01810 TaxID=2975951 RepID=UPI002DDB32C9|nr:hypothetical protein [Streptosporangium sp. NBC_01810]WSA23735.1 hypothetical protein OIE13_22600 [Streptosporangium sp. NBC_01810]